MIDHNKYTLLDKFMGCVLVYAITVATVDLIGFIHNELELYMGEAGRYTPLPIPEIWLDKLVDVFPERFMQFEGLLGIVVVLFFIIVMKCDDFLNRP